MLSYVISSATNFFHLPVEDDFDLDTKHITWDGLSSTPSTSSSSPSSSRSTPSSPSPPLTGKLPDEIVRSVLDQDDLYTILGLTRTGRLDKMTIRRAYLARSRACHPDKYPHSDKATLAFQRVAVAYEILSQPSKRRRYDTRPYDVFAARPPVHYGHETFRGVMLGVINDVLDSDLEFMRALLRAVNDGNPFIRFGEQELDRLLESLDAIRKRALVCRTCLFALHAQVTRLVEVQQALGQLSYFDVLGRSRLGIRMVRITLALPVALEEALVEEEREEDYKVLPGQFKLLVLRMDGLLEKVEKLF